MTQIVINLNVFSFLHTQKTPPICVQKDDFSAHEMEKCYFYKTVCLKMMVLDEFRRRFSRRTLSNKLA